MLAYVLHMLLEDTSCSVYSPCLIPTLTQHCPNRSFVFFILRICGVNSEDLHNQRSKLTQDTQVRRWDNGPGYFLAGMSYFLESSLVVSQLARN